MPKRSKEDMAARRREILRAARACFARKGFHATTIADISAEARVSAGGIYIHFANKHAIAAAIGGEATAQLQEGGPPRLLELFDGLRSAAGLEDARLDLNLWAEALRDDVLLAMVNDAMNAYRAGLRRALPPGRNDAGWVAIIEALSLGLEVQRALGRAQGPRTRSTLETLLEGDSYTR